MTETLKKGELIPLTFDIMFTEIFNNPDNICILEEFISNYLDIPLNLVIGNLEILSRRLSKEERYDSRKEVDLLLNYQGKKINIEMSNSASDGVINRNVVYLCKIHGRQLKTSDINYSKINDTIQIMFNNFDTDNDLKTTWYLRDDAGNILTSKLRIDIINLVKGKDLCYTGSEKVDYLINWCKLLTTNNKDNIKDISCQIMSHKSTNTLMSNMSMLSEENEMVRLYTKLSRREMEYNTLIVEATEKGLKEGRQKGLEQGIKEGLEQGIEKGTQQKTLEIAKKMLNKNIDITTIEEITGLTKEEITKLK